MPLSLQNPSPFFLLANNPLKFRLFLLTKLPAAFIAGIRIKECNEEICSVSVPYKWLTQNPFRSTYFACLSMAAEMSTGALAMANVYRRKPSTSMLITSVDSKYYKKAIGKTIFTCKEGLAIKQTIDTAYTTISPQTIRVRSEGFNRQNELVAEFWFTWSFKVKQ
jgi:hypothetical protein